MSFPMYQSGNSEVNDLPRAKHQGREDVYQAFK